MTALQDEYTHLPTYSELRGTVTNIQNDDPVILTIESRINHKVKIVKHEIIFISEDPDIDAESFTLDKLLNREVSIFRTSSEYRILVKENEGKSK